jgi:hypothetical protein
LDGWGAKRVRNRGYDVGNAVYASLCQKTAYSMSDILMTAVGYGGDTDTVASIALGIISLHPNAIKDLNPSLYDHLEDGDYGIEYLSALDKRLLEAFPKPDLKSDEGKPLSELFVSTDGDIKPFVEL